MGMAKKKIVPPANHIELLGMRGKDRITGFEGVIITVAFDLFGCVQVVLRPAQDKDGKLPDAHFFDVGRVEITDDARVMPLPNFYTPATHEKGPAERPKGLLR